MNPRVLTLLPRLFVSFKLTVKQIDTIMPVPFRSHFLQLGSFVLQGLVCEKVVVLTKRYPDTKPKSTDNTIHTTTNDMISNNQPLHYYSSFSSSSSSINIDGPPSENDIVCARGRAYWDHPGNVQYRQLIADATTRYATTTSKLEKSMLVTEIIDRIKYEKNGRFVKKQRTNNKVASSSLSSSSSSKSSKWIEVDEEQIREKVSQSLRDGLCGIYRSATKAKKQRRGKVNEQFNIDIERMLYSNVIVAAKIAQLTNEIAKATAEAAASAKENMCCSSDSEIDCSDYSSGDDDETVIISNILDRGNFDILETIKSDKSLIGGYLNAQTAANIQSEILCL
jgi:hypothetical protein